MSLVARWTLNGELTDSSGNGYTLTMTSGSATYTTGIASQKCWTGNGGTAYPYATGITLGTSATISWWEKTTVTNDMSWAMSCTAFSNGMNLYHASIYTLNIGDGNENPFLTVGGSNISVYTDSRWHHLVVTFNGTNNAKLYIDGAYRGTAKTYRDNTMSSARFDIGSWHNDTSYVWAGGICDVRIYDTVLNGHDIYRLYKTFSPTLDLNYGLTIPISPNTTTAYTTYDSGAAKGLPYTSASLSSKNTSPSAGNYLPSMNGSQSWSGTTNTFTNSGSCTGFDDEGYITKGTITESSSSSGSITTLTATTTGPTVIVTNLDTDVLAGVGVSGAVVADSAYNAVWNDIADCIEVPEDTELEYGRAYCTDGEKFYKSTKYLDDGYIGIHSDTAGMFMGNKDTPNQLRVASAGFVLAYVDKKYPCGTPLTVTENGYLTKLKDEDIERYPYKLVGTFWKDEPLEWWGFDLALNDNLLVEVKGRKWIKVK